MPEAAATALGPARAVFPQGLLLVIEGIDGTGKSTLARGVVEALNAAGRPAVFSCEPTHGPIGRRIRDLAARSERVPLEEEIDLFLADRREHQAGLIRPALAAGKVVVLDRYYYSSVAYQGARGGDPQEILRRNEAEALRPDVLVMLELPVEEALRRITHARGGAPDAFEGESYLRRVESLFATIQHPRLVRLDARQSADVLRAQVLTLAELQPPAAASH